MQFNYGEDIIKRLHDRDVLLHSEENITHNSSLKMFQW